MTRFRPCIDLHAGQVKQIVGGTLTDTTSTSTSTNTTSTTSSSLKTNHISPHPASHFAQLYRDADVRGAHVIMLGPGNEDAARGALRAWPGRLQVGGGITDGNAMGWIEEGAEKVIITSFLFPQGRFSMPRLTSVLASLDNDPSRLVIDLSCRRKGTTWFVAMNKWQTLTETEVNQETISLLEPHCSEFLIHAADNEGLQSGIDVDLVRRLSEWCSIPVTYAGGARDIGDLDLVERESQGKVDLTIGSALDCFGGKGCRFAECVEWNRRRKGERR